MVEYAIPAVTLVHFGVFESPGGILDKVYAGRLHPLPFHICKTLKKKGSAFQNIGKYVVPLPFNQHFFFFCLPFHIPFFTDKVPLLYTFHLN